MDLVSAERLERLRRWAGVPVGQREDEWVREFEAAFWPTWLFDLETVGYGSEDRRPYHWVRLPNSETALPGLEPRWMRPAMMVDGLIERGEGLILGEPSQPPMVVMTLAEVVSYRLYGRAFALPLEAPPVHAVAHPGENVELHPPSEANFPNWARINVRRFLREALGVEAPRACGARYPNGWSGLAFDLEPADGDEARRRAAFEGLRPLMPRRLPYVYHPGLSDAPTMTPF